MGTFLVVVAFTFTDVLGTSATQDASLREASELRASRVAAALSISNTSGSASGGGTDVTASVYNQGSSSYGDFSRMDVLVQYTTDTGDREVQHLKYVCKELCGGAGNPDQGEWTVSGIDPDTYNPKMWDPDEVITVDILVSPAVKSNTAVLVAVVTPWGISDTSAVTNP